MDQRHRSFVGILGLASLLLAAAAAATRFPLQAPEEIDLEAAALYSFPERTNAYTRFRARLQSQEEGGAAGEGEVTLLGVVQAASESFSVLIEASGSAALSGPPVYEFAWMEGASLQYLPHLGCRTGETAHLEHHFESLIDVARHLKGKASLARAALILNNRLVDQYALEPDNLASPDPSVLEMLELRQGELYVDRFSGALLRVKIMGTARSALLSGDRSRPGELSYQWDLIPVGQPVSLGLPERCRTAVPAGFPIPTPPDAFNYGDWEAQDQILDIYFETYFTVDELAAFYRREAPKSGWRQEFVEMIPGQGGILRFESRNGLLTVKLSEPQEPHGPAYVAIEQIR